MQAYRGELGVFDERCNSVVVTNEPTPVSVLWKLTYRCNLACKHCMLNAVHRESTWCNELSEDQAAQLARDIGSLVPAAIVVIAGGEPLLRMDLPSIVAALADAGLVPVIHTNGMLLDEFQAARLRFAGALGVSISLDSSSAQFHDHLRGRIGAWRSASAGITAARAVGLEVMMQTTLLEQNLDELPAIVQMAYTSEIRSLNLSILSASNCSALGSIELDLSNERALPDLARLQNSFPGLALTAGSVTDAWSGLVSRGKRSARMNVKFSSRRGDRQLLHISPEGEISHSPSDLKPALRCMQENSM